MIKINMLCILRKRPVILKFRVDMEKVLLLAMSPPFWEGEVGRVGMSSLNKVLDCGGRVFFGLYYEERM